MNIKRFLFSACAFILLGCQEHVPQSGMWTGALVVGENKHIPFRLFLDLNSATPAGYFLNGPERTSIPEILVHGDSLSLLFSEYGAAMRGIWDGKEWQGRFFRYRTDTSSNYFAVTPVHVITEHPGSGSSTGLPLLGNYQANISGVQGIDSTTRAKFWMKGDSVFGTLIAPDGDYGLLAGTQIGSQVTLTRFTGWQAFLLELERQDTHWTGRLYSRSGKPMELTLVPQPVLATEQHSSIMTTMKNRKKPFTFFGTTSTGKFLSSEDPSLNNKALLIDIMGTWCHNCMDAAPLLQQISSEFEKDGLVVIGLAFEISDNPEVAKKNLALFQKRYRITYPMLFCGSTNEENVGQKLRSQLNNFSGYPTTLFLNKKGVVKSIHVGFHGPGTGEEYQRQVQQYYKTVQELLQ